jgi:hypothetical protein
VCPYVARVPRLLQIGNGSYFSPDNWEYQTAWANCAKSSYGIELDYIGIWNERSWGTEDYVIGLRNSLDAAGHTNTKIVLPDGAPLPGPPPAVCCLPAHPLLLPPALLHHCLWPLAAPGRLPIVAALAKRRRPKPGVYHDGCRCQRVLQRRF